MAEGETQGFGAIVGHWRCEVHAWISSQTDSECTVSVQCVFRTFAWGYDVRYCSAWSACDGQSAGRGDFHAQSGYGQTVDTVAYDGAFAVPRGTSDRTVSVRASIVMPDYEPGSSFAESWVTIPAVPVDLPAPPTGVSASRQSDGVWTVSWVNSDTDAAPYASVEMQVRDGDGEWGAPAGGSVSLAGGSQTATWQYGSANSRYKFRVRGVNASGASAWAESGYGYTTPAAPGSLSATFSSGSVALTWTKTAPYADSVQVQRSGDGSAWSGAATPASSATSWTDADPPSGTAWYRVRYGVGGLWGPWAQAGPVSTYTSSDYPTVSITGPQSPVRTRPVEVEWTVGGPDQVASQSVALVVGGTVVDAVEPSASARSASLAAEGLPDGRTGTVVVSATDTKGLSTTAVLQVTADYWPPAAPSATVTYSGGSATVHVAAGSGASVSPTTSVDVYRVPADGSEEAVALGAAPGDVEDRYPPLNVAYSYRVVAHSGGGKTAEASVQAKVESRGGYVDFPDGESFAVLLDPSHSETVERSGEAVDFAGSSPYPVWYPGTDVGVSPTFGFKVLRADYDALRDEAYASDEVWVRDGFGHVWHGHPRWTISPAVGGRYADVTLDLTVTEVR